jgi:uncharacterized protein YijF (DUF1287 family)
MFTLIILPNFKGNKKDWIWAITLCLILDAITILGVTPSYGQTGQEIANSALTLTKDNVQYDATYYSIPYPNGDVPSNKGVCTDVVIRTYRKVGIDLQKEIHEDMKANFNDYPSKRIWGLTHTDKNIDHRRVPNIERFLTREGMMVKSADPYEPGDIVTWTLYGGQTHIGIVSNIKVPNTNRYKIIHNIGSGQVLEDCLYSYKIRYHFKYINVL